ncbi:MAG: hypothetical protein KatS3mg042_0668 [Rhodothermaceae bacterium]|nr:MAG: hypothetical protein KatS3mg042_0668 [Rhodothermaceae bacterium]
METRAYPAPRERTLAEILEDLRKPVHPKHIRRKRIQTTRSSYEADYIPHTTIRDYLDYYAPGWDWHCKLFAVDGKLYVEGHLTIHGSDGSLTRAGLGNEDSDLDGYGDPSSNAEAQALRRAAMAFGLGRDLWRRK